MKSIYLIIIIALFTNCTQNEIKNGKLDEVITVSEENTAEQIGFLEGQETKSNIPLTDNEIKDVVRQLIMKMNNFENHSYELKDGFEINIADLNNDGYNDAIAVIIGSNTSGGNSWREDVAVFLNNSQTKKIKHYKDLNTNYDLEYKKIDNIEILDDRSFIVTARGYKDDDAQCCPTLPINLNYKFIGNELNKIQNKFNPDEILGKYRMWNKENDCYAIAEITKKSGNKYFAMFSLECDDNFGFGNFVSIKESSLYMENDEIYNGCNIYLDKDKLAVKWLTDDNIEYYSKY